jgi:hypothetical protein
MLETVLPENAFKGMWGWKRCSVKRVKFKGRGEKSYENKDKR